MEHTDRFIPRPWILKYSIRVSLPAPTNRLNSTKQTLRAIRITHSHRDIGYYNHSNF